MGVIFDEKFGGKSARSGICFFISYVEIAKVSIAMDDDLRG